MLLHGIMSTIAEFYSRNLANEVTKGMTQKAMTGGTNGKATIGYLNVPHVMNLAATSALVEPDPTRAECEVGIRGIRDGELLNCNAPREASSTAASPHRPPRNDQRRPPALSTMQKMLSNPYYKGDVIVPWCHL